MIWLSAIFQRTLQHRVSAIHIKAVYNSAILLSIKIPTRPVQLPTGLGMACILPAPDLLQHGRTFCQMWSARSLTLTIHEFWF